MDRVSRIVASAAVSITAFALVATMATPAAPIAARSTAALRPAAPTRVVRPSLRRPRPKAARTLARRTAPIAYAVQAGDTLSSIARKQLGSADRWPALWWVNRKTIHNPNEITTANRLSMPDKKLTGSWLVRRAMAAIPKPVIRVAAKFTTSTSTAPPQPAPVSHVAPSGSAFEQCVETAESGGDPTAYNASSGASGLFGDLLSTWDSLGLGYSGGASTAPVSVQIQGFWKLYDEDGMAPWVADGCPQRFGY